MSHHPDLSGLTVAIVAASGYAADPHAVGRATARLEDRGCRVKNFYDAGARHQRFGGTDAVRLQQLNDAIVDPQVDIVIALRGGYGLSRLLPMLECERLAASGKLLVGHSDFTALHMAMLAQGGTISFAGPMICDDFSRDEPSAYTLDSFWNCMTRSEHTIAFEARDNPSVDVSGILWGGNLTMLTHLVGTPYLPRIEGGILFIEDVNEHPYRVERMLLQLAHAGLLRQQAIVLGDFSAYRLNEYDNGYDFDAMVGYLRARLGIPILTGLPFGHIRDKATLAVGSQARLHCNGSNAMLTMSGYPTLAARV
ncbi:muramoyltetrapeptide carboxypeptidase [Noviherbaspirillum saxi]|uniref:Muramoyltetrapeptide carboxypeptidase n=1 Tax=Noviherbaspirillum saxi TaxID=2320863 RepID=A0A3A3FMV0_9BURK|nr:muramoyltetrapeptide carboxypeptidase [Noviherbaspirillum saxi]RJF95805.1 muramoyltetrapeptide carboxypeptidase [Noviherbaspirillum saxi]